MVDCGATAHIITEKDKILRFDETFNCDKHFMELAYATRANNVALKRGDAHITLKNENGQLIDITLSNALLVPRTHETFSLYKLQQKMRRESTFDYSGQN